MRSHRLICISSGRNWHSVQNGDERYFNDVITIDIKDEKYHYEISSPNIWVGRISYMHNDGMDFYVETNRLAKAIEKKIAEAQTMGERDNLIYNQMIQVAYLNNICLVTKKDESLELSDDDEIANEEYNRNIISIPLKSMNFDKKWVAAKPVKDNIVNLFQGYIPTFFLWGLFKHTENIIKAKQIIHDLTHNNLDDQQTLAYLQDIAKIFSPANPRGEFNRKLHYIIRKLQDPALPQQLEQINIRATASERRLVIA